MCTLVVWVTGSSERPLVVAANRDERLDRPASPPRIGSGSASGASNVFGSSAHSRFAAPRDELAGGTWLGLNEHGLFVGLTNRAGTPPDPTRRSRGLLVTDALAFASAVELDARLEGLDPRAHGPFHLVYADRRAAFLAWIDGEALRREPLAQGLHVVTERSAHDRGRRAALIHRLWPRDVGADPDPLARELRTVLAQHADDPFEATCIHADAFGYGTRSSAVVVLGSSWDATRFYWAEGRPCVTPFVELGSVIEQLAPRRES